MKFKDAEAADFRLQIQMFGAFEVRIDGVSIPPLRTRKVQWLLALLLLRHGQPLDRAWLAGTLWPDSESPQALYNLRQSLSNLRHALGETGQCLHASMVNSLSLDVTSVEVDVLVFDAAIASGDSAALEKAIALYRGPLLEGCAEEWVFAERRVREENYLSAIETLAEKALERGEVSAEIKYLRLVIQADPFHERAQRALILALAGVGDYGAAVQTYWELRRLLHRELNTEPDPETLAVFQQVRAEAQRKRRTQARVVVPLPTREAPVRQLPSPLTALVGRRAELEQIIPMLNTVRLLTLTGPGGVGKTRLAIAAAEQVAGEYVDGVFFVDLAALSDPILLVHTVAQVLQIREEPGLSLFSTLQVSLQSKTLLLLLDNCEHLLDSCADMANVLLQNCPSVRILATSRQNLGLAGEVDWRVTPLSTPSLSDLAQGKPAQKDWVSLLSEYEAVQLFILRAQYALPSFRMTPRNAAAIARICAHLDGVPLALELAAARVRALSVEEIYRNLNNRFRLLTGGNRAALPRQKTLRALIDWSYDLLSEPEKELLCRLSVFAGGWTLQAAEEVCTEESPEREATFEAWEVLDLLSALVDKSLVMVEQEEGRTRYRLLETMRQYALDRLQERGEVERMKRRHQAFFVVLAEAAEPELQGPQQPTWLHHLEQDHANLRQALEGGSQEAALRIVGALWRYLQVRSYFSEGREWLTGALAGAEVQGGTPARAKALRGAGVLAWCQGESLPARTLHEESLTLCRALGDRSGIADSLQSLGNVASGQGNYEEARALYSESLALRRDLGSKRGIATLLNNLGNLASDQGDPRTAQLLLEESLQLRRELEDKEGIASSLNNLGNVAMDLKDLAKARALYSEGLMLRRELGNKLGIAVALYNLAGIAYQQEDLPATRILYAESLSLYRELGYKRGIAYSLEGFGALALKEEQAKRVAYLCAAAEALRKAIDTPLTPSHRGQYEDLVAWSCASLGQDSFAIAWSEGSALTLEQAIEYALGDPIGLMTG